MPGGTRIFVARALSLPYDSRTAQASLSDGTLPGDRRLEIQMAKRERFELRLPANDMAMVKRAAQAGGWPGTSLVQQSGGVERHLMDSADGSPMGRLARSIPAIPDLPPPLSTLGAGWEV